MAFIRKPFTCQCEVWQFVTKLVWLWCPLPVSSSVIRVGFPWLMKFCGREEETPQLSSSLSLPVRADERSAEGAALWISCLFKCLQLKIICIPKWHILGWCILSFSRWLISSFLSLNIPQFILPFLFWMFVSISLLEILLAVNILLTCILVHMYTSFFRIVLTQSMVLWLAALVLAVSSSQMQVDGPHPHLLHEKLWYPADWNKISRWILSTLKFENHCSEIYTLGWIEEL